MYDLFFIGSTGYDFKQLKELYPHARSVETVDEAREKSKTDMYWVLWDDVILDKNFNFDYKPDNLDKIYVWRNGDPLTQPGLVLFPKKRKISNREIQYRYFVNFVGIDEIATYTKGYDVVFISNSEIFADENYRKLLDHAHLHSNVFRVENVIGIHNAHIEAAKVATTSMVWIVDADAEILPSFKFYFDRKLAANEEEMTHLWHSRNPITGLEYGYGGVKLFPREKLLSMNISSVDMTTSVTNDIKIVPEVSNITRFNTDPLSTWRSAFRECAKLSSKIINKQVNEETSKRLDQWCFNTSSEMFAEYARGGASAGEWFGRTYKDNKEMLFKINDYKWLAAEFEQHIKMFPPSTFK